MGDTVLTVQSLSCAVLSLHKEVQFVFTLEDSLVTGTAGIMDPANTKLKEDPEQHSSKEDTEEEGCDSLFSEDDAIGEDCVVTTPATPGCNPLQYPFQSLGRRPHSAMGLQAEHTDLSIPPKSPIPGRIAGKGRQRTFSTSATISTEREPITRASRRTIYTAGRPPWYDVRNKDTTRDEFIFYSKRLIRLVIEYSLSLLPFESVSVSTPQGLHYQGRRCTEKKICGVSILRAGETMEQALSDVCKDIRIGKILIQTNWESGEPELYYLRLPKDIKDYQVILMDATVATGAAAMMAIRVLLDHDVPEENINLVSLLMAESGVHTIAYAFPGVKIITTAVDPEINDRFHVMPGIGNFGDRYFGTEPKIQHKFRNENSPGLKEMK